LFITFEGIEGCGKTTQIKRLVDRLGRHSIPFVLTLEPGGTRLGEAIRKILLDSQNRAMSPLAELLLYEADRAQHVKEVIKPALEQKKWVLCDRFFDATTVYQGYSRGLDMDLVKKLNEESSLGIWPDMTFVLDCPVETGLARARKRESFRADSSDGAQDRFEREAQAFHESVREGYLALAKADSKRFVLVDASKAEDELEEEIFEYIKPYTQEYRSVTSQGSNLRTIK
jgi:dTMP kinase